MTKTKTYRIVVLPGDGIGPEIVEAALDVLETVQKVAGGFSLAYEFHKAGAACYRDTGEAITPEAIEAFRNADATLKGPVGLPDVRKPDGTEAGLLGGILRVGFDLYANVRPIRLFPNAATPLAGHEADGIDYVIVRENTEGLYLSRGLGLVTPHAATDTLLLTAHGCERITRFAFQTAINKQHGAPEDGRKRVTLVDKSNVLRSFAFFRRIFLQVAEEFPEVAAECIYVDAAAAALVSRPQHFQVIVTENLFGDILSDLGGATIGGLGMCPSANIGERRAYSNPSTDRRRTSPAAAWPTGLPDHVGRHDAGPPRRGEGRGNAGGCIVEGLRAARNPVQDRRRGGRRGFHRRNRRQTGPTGVVI